jgi:hypothetical protein
MPKSIRFGLALKNQLVHLRRFTTWADARSTIIDQIAFFNNRSGLHYSLKHQNLLKHEYALR